MSSEWKVLGLIYIFLRPSKILSDLPLTRYLIHAVKTLTHLHCPSTRTHTHMWIHTNLVLLLSVPLCEVCLSAGLLHVIIHLASWQPFNQTLASRIEPKPFSTGTAVTMVTVEVCDPPASQRMQCCFVWVCFSLRKHQLCVCVSVSPCFLLSCFFPCGRSTYLPALSYSPEACG